MRFKLTLKDILQDLLTESVSQDAVLDAIRNKYHVRIRYDDEGPDSKGSPKASRVIQPMAFGKTKKGNLVVRAFQVGGGSRRGAPNWKFFLLDRITSWRPMKKKKFLTPPDTSYGEYNAKGDRSMGEFIDNSKFGDDLSPLEKERLRTAQIGNAPKISAKNTSGPIAANQQMKKNIYTSQPNSKRYAMYRKNVADTKDEIDRFSDDVWDKAEAEKNLQNSVPKPQPNDRSSNDDDYDVYDVDFDDNDFIPNNNRRKL